jgi:hypothetical protein
VHRNGEFLKSDRETLQSDFLNWKPEKKRKKEEEEEEEEVKTGHGGSHL